MQKENMRKILDRIKEYDSIMLFRHVRMDGDCTGATKGMKALLQASFPDKKIYLIDSQTSDFLSFLGSDEADVEDAVYERSLAIVLDTGTQKRISNPKYTLCREVIKIDHHIPIDNYGDVMWVEEERSSTCEMVAAFYDAFREELVLTKEAAYYLYTGMVTDSGRFRYRSVSGDTMRLAGMLLDTGIDTDTLYANLYLEDFDFLKFKAHVYNAMQITPNGVAYLFVDKAMQEKFGLTLESASSAVSFMDGIRGSLIWIAFIENGDAEGSIRVRLRSRFQPINMIAENYRGGGHDCAAGATVYGKEEMQALLNEADALLKQYKETHEGWL